MRKQESRFMLFLLLLLFPLLLNAAQGDLKSKLAALPGVSEVEPLKSTQYSEKYTMMFEHPLDYKNPQAGKFLQRVIVGHAGYDRPTVIVTEGYWGDYATRENYVEELSKLLNTNVVFVEYRYFGKSMPNPCNWDYLTVENSLNDLHQVRNALKSIYPGKWISTGISKGGQTTLFYRTYFPNDVDISVPYVAPLNRSVEDGRHQPFIENKVSTTQNRQKVKEFQLELLKRKAELMPLFRKHCEEKKYAFRASEEDIFDYCVMEYAFGLWQWGTPMDKIPALTASNEEIFNHFIAMIEPDYFSKQTPYTSFNVQAAHELGYYGYDMKPFRKYMSLKTTKDYLRRLMLPDELRNVRFDKTLYNNTMKFLKKNDPKMIFIYGGIDPWGASGCTWIKGKQNIKVYVQPDGSHRTRIGTMKPEVQKEIIDRLKRWLGE
ncbi:S28 family serine protease [uncultured Bacteroides sp.]|uniref:S28 family serine protease n=1 Tax=uncultured Bacteroides sp. TaxID=162156 RepID=UPI002AA894F4|nr:S28 family serine protease [uncultured Bacteroides sp.]